ncbi:MAG: integrase arm-type DNA-binding domain-containing protein [Alphaproteobacteria bacterium]|nr:integrase arm-type DNA-binding domain-containing protein [Alphaproteobacteria bacterium]
MPTIKLTKRKIDTLKPGPKDVFYWDAEIKGFGLKVTPKGKKTFLVQYRPGGRHTPTRKVFIGPYGKVTPHKARREATRFLGLVADGKDPALEKRQARQRAITDRLSDVVEEFLKKHAAKNRSVKEVERIFRHDVIPEWEKRSIHDIGKRDIIHLVEKIEGRGAPVMAKRLLAHLRKFFNWCVSRDYLQVSPCSGVATSYREKARHRVLTDDELVDIINAARQIGGIYGGIVQLLVYTAQRRAEVSELRWEELDLDQSLWTLPGERTKNGKPHFIHLSEQAMEVLKDIPKVGEFVFTTNGRTPFSGFSKAKRQLDELSTVSDWRLHDIRRTATTGIAHLGIPPHIADKVLNHQGGTISGVAAVYQRHDFLEERKTALDAWGNYVQSLLDETDRDNVVNIHEG